MVLLLLLRLTVYESRRHEPSVTVIRAVAGAHLPSRPASSTAADRVQIRGSPALLRASKSLVCTAHVLLLLLRLDCTLCRSLAAVCLRIPQLHPACQRLRALGIAIGAAAANCAAATANAAQL